MTNIGTDILGLPTTVGGLTGSEWVPVVQGGTTKRTQSSYMGVGAITQFFPCGIDYVMSADGGVLPLGVNGAGIVVPFDCTITRVDAYANVPSGGATIDIWKTTYALFDGGASAPTSANSITGNSQPIIASDARYTDTTLTGWTVALSQGDILWYNLISVFACTSITVALKCNRVIP